VERNNDMLGQWLRHVQRQEDTNREDPRRGNRRAPSPHFDNEIPNAADPPLQFANILDTFGKLRVTAVRLG